VARNRFNLTSSRITPQSVRRLRASNNTRADANGAAAIHVSLNRDRLAKSVGRDTAKPIFTSVLQNQLDGRAQAFTAFFHAASLSVGAGNLRRPADKPIAVSLNDRSEFVSHGKSIDPKRLPQAGRRFDRNKDAEPRGHHNRAPSEMRDEDECSKLAPAARG
jgi:hypothetical protein